MRLNNYSKFILVIVLSVALVLFIKENFHFFLIFTSLLLLLLLFLHYPSFPLGIQVNGMFLYLTCMPLLIGKMPETNLTSLVHFSLVILYLTGLVFFHGKKKIKIDLVHFLFFFFTALILVNYLRAPTDYTTKYVGYFSLLCFCPFIATIFIKNTKQVKHFLMLILILGIFSMVLSSVSLLLTPDIEKIKHFQLSAGEVYTNYQITLAVSGLILTFILDTQSSIRAKLSLFIVLLVLLYFINLGGGKGPLYAFLGVVTFYFLFLSPYKNIKRFLFIPAIFGFFFIFLHLMPPYVYGLISPTKIIGSASIEWRSLLFAESIKLISESPMTGNGLCALFRNTGWMNYPHNLLLEIWQDLGLIGLVIFLCFLLVVIAESIFAIGKQKSLVLPFIMVFIFSFFEGMVAGSIYTNTLLWFSGGMIFSVNRLIK